MLLLMAQSACLMFVSGHLFYSTLFFGKKCVAQTGQIA